MTTVNLNHDLWGMRPCPEEAAPDEDPSELFMLTYDGEDVEGSTIYHYGFACVVLDDLREGMGPPWR